MRPRRQGARVDCECFLVFCFFLNSECQPPLFRPSPSFSSRTERTKESNDACPEGIMKARPQHPPPEIGKPAVERGKRGVVHAVLNGGARKLGSSVIFAEGPILQVQTSTCIQVSSPVPSVDQWRFFVGRNFFAWYEGTCIGYAFQSQAKIYFQVFFR